jgi:uncharacterized protein YneF (UPF0154 family)
MNNETLQGFGAVFLAVIIVWGAIGIGVLIGWLISRNKR